MYTKILTNYIVIFSLLFLTTPNTFAKDYPLEIIGQTAPLQTIESYSILSPDGKLYFKSSNLSLYDIATGRLIGKFQGLNSIYITKIEFHPSGKFIGAIGKDAMQRGTLAFWDIYDGVMIKAMNDQDFSDFTFHPDGNIFAITAMLDLLKMNTAILPKESDLVKQNEYLESLGGVQVYNFKSMERIRTYHHSKTMFPEMQGTFSKTRFSKNGDLLAGFGSTDLAVWQVNDGKVVFDGKPVFDNPQVAEMVYSLDFHPKNKEILLSTIAPSTGKNGMTTFLSEVEQYDLSKGELIRKFQTNIDYVTKVRYLNEEKNICIIGKSNILQKKYVQPLILNSKTGKNEIIFNFDMPRISDISLSPDGKYILFTDFTKNILWDLTTHRLAKSMNYSSSVDGLINCFFIENGKKIITMGAQKISIWNMPTLKKEKSISIETGIIKLSNKENFLICTIDNLFYPDSSKTEIIDLYKGEICFSVKGNASFADMNPDETLVATGGGSYEKNKIQQGINIWNFKDNVKVATCKRNKAGIMDIQFSLDGKNLISNSYDKKIYVWDAKTFKKKKKISKKLKLFQGQIGSKSALSPDGKIYVTTAAGSSIKKINEFANVYDLKREINK